jgi:hypothetical protein
MMAWLDVPSDRHPKVSSSPSADLATGASLSNLPIDAFWRCAPRGMGLRVHSS